MCIIIRLIIDILDGMSEIFSFIEFLYDLWLFTMFYVLYFDEEDVIEDWADVFWPVIEEFEESVAKEVHWDLVFAVLREEVKVVEDY